MQQSQLIKKGETVLTYLGTEPPFSGKYNDFWEKGTYICKRCNAVLYRSGAKFNAGSGWPSFDDEIPGAVKKIPDPGGARREIACASCGAHLGHIFLREGFTKKSVRHCVNSMSLLFVPADRHRA